MPPISDNDAARRKTDAYEWLATAVSFLGADNPESAWAAMRSAQDVALKFEADNSCFDRLYQSIAVAIVAEHGPDSGTSELNRDIAAPSTNRSIDHLARKLAFEREQMIRRISEQEGEKHSQSIFAKKEPGPPRIPFFRSES